MKRILVLGAGRYNKAAIESAKKFGYYIICMDRDIDAPAKIFADEFYCIDFSNKHDTLSLASKTKIDAVIPLNDWGVPVASYVSENLNLIGISKKCAEIVTDKFKMRECWSQNNIKCPQYIKVKDLHTAKMKVHEIGFPCIFKPVDSRVAGSRGVIRVKNEQEIESAFTFSTRFSITGEILIESFIDANIEHSAEVLVYQGENYILSISDKIKTPYPYRVDKEVIYPTSLTGEVLETLKDTIIACLKAIKLTVGAAHIEICTTANGEHIPFEVSARCGGGGTPTPIIKYVTGIDMFVELCNILTDNKVGNLTPAIQNDCVYHFITPKPGKIYYINFDILKDNGKVLDYGIFKKIGDNVEKVETAIDRSGFVIYKDRHFNSDDILLTN